MAKFFSKHTHLAPMVVEEFYRRTGNSDCRVRTHTKAPAQKGPGWDSKSKGRCQSKKTCCWPLTVLLRCGTICNSHMGYRSDTGRTFIPGAHAEGTWHTVLPSYSKARGKGGPFLSGREFRDQIKLFNKGIWAGEKVVNVHAYSTFQSRRDTSKYPSLLFWVPVCEWLQPGPQDYS